MTLDATGGNEIRNTTRTCFYYQYVLVTKEGSIPVFQMMSVDQRSFQIAHFLRLILSKDVPRPPYSHVRFQARFGERCGGNIRKMQRFAKLFTNLL